MDNVQKLVNIDLAKKRNLYAVFNILLVLIRSGFVNTAMNGIIEATPNISKKAITKIIPNNNIARLRS